jgi:general stress protein 26
MPRQSAQSRRLAELMEGIDIAMCTTLGPNGYPVSRPLSTQAAAFDGERVWFFVAADSPKVEEIRAHPKVNLGYVSHAKNTYVSLAGDARVYRDQALIDEMWSDALKAYFPRGRTDPNLALLEVMATSAEYWDGPASTLGKLVRFVIARVTKREEVLGENRIVDLGRGASARKRLPPSHADARKGARRAAKSVLATGAGAKKAMSARKSPAKKAGGARASAAKTAGRTRKPASKRSGSARKTAAAAARKRTR